LTVNSILSVLFIKFQQIQILS